MTARNRKRSSSSAARPSRKKDCAEVSIPNDLNALALLASGKKEYQPMLAAYAKEVAAFKADGMASWSYGYATLFLAEYVAATHDQSVMDGLRRLAERDRPRPERAWAHGATSSPCRMETATATAA